MGTGYIPVFIPFHWCISWKDLGDFNLLFVPVQVRIWIAFLFSSLFRSVHSGQVPFSSPFHFQQCIRMRWHPDQTSRFRSFDLHVQIHHELEKFIFLMAEGRPAPLFESLELRVQRCTASDTVFYFLRVLPYDLHTCTESGSHRDSRMATPNTFSTTPKHTHSDVTLYLILWYKERKQCIIWYGLKEFLEPVNDIGSEHWY